MQQKAAHQRYKEVKRAAIDVRKQKLQVCVMLGIPQSSPENLFSCSAATISLSPDTHVPDAKTTRANIDACKQNLQVSCIIWGMQCCCTECWCWLGMNKICM